VGTELERVAMLRGLFAAASPRVLEGIGDDAAVLAPSEHPLVWTIDAAVEGVHFRRDLASFEDVGYRATMAAASDLAAMGADPIALLAALVLPADVSDEDLRSLARGQRAAADAIGAPLVGGNLARGEELSITTTALGSTPRPLRRDGARPGDAVWLAGPVGLAAAGFRLLERGLPAESAEARRAVAAWRRPAARIADGLSARAAATAGIDVSDGLARDVGHVARASGVCAVLEARAIVAADLRAAASALGEDPLELALHGGEDYALVVCAPKGEAPPAGFVVIGQCEATDPSTSSAVVLLGEDGARRPLEERGFDHFALRAPR
jgi:thiamine-monophosphate kinase